MGYRLVKLPVEFFNELLTEGRRFPSREGDTLIVAKGLPEGAKLEAVSMDIRFEYNEIVLKYSHPSWEDMQPEYMIPFVNVEYKIKHDHELQGDFCYKTGKITTRVG